MFHGVYTAIITPFRDGSVDEKKLEELVNYQIDAGMKGIVACGTTGEFITLNQDEQKRIITLCSELCKDKVQLIIGTGAIQTSQTIAQSQYAQQAGADGVLVMTPWYVKPSQESLYQHYKALNDEVDIPIIIYNNPTRTGVEISFETLVSLAAFKNIRGYKESGSCLQRISALKCHLGDRLSLLAGNDDPFAAHLAMGGHGGFMMGSNVAPHLFVDLMKAWDANNLQEFKDQWIAMYPLLSALALETNPAPIKFAMALVHGVSLESRLPFAPLKVSTQAAIEAALEELGLWTPIRAVRD